MPITTPSPYRKLRLLYLARILLEQTDEENSMTAPELISALDTYGVTAERKAVYDDIELLRVYGLDVKLLRGKERGYFIASRDFELAELKLLVDAVQSSRFITTKKSEELIGKLSKLASEPQAKQFHRQVYVLGRAKAFNEAVYYNIDAIHAAINASRKISFRYFDYNVQRKRVYRKDGGAYTRTPVALCWHDDNYYLITYSPKHGDAFAHYRVDRMDNVLTLDEPGDDYSGEDFNIADHAKRTFGMYYGETVKAELAFDNSLAGVVLDHFGGDARLTDTDDGRFTISAEVSQSPVFLAWVFQFGRRASILAPDNLRDAMRVMIAENADMYAV
jgi:predicted DNA-binding transcriptional regulator YafY